MHLYLFILRFYEPTLALMTDSTWSYGSDTQVESKPTLELLNKQMRENVQVYSIRTME